MKSTQITSIAQTRIQMDGLIFDLHALHVLRAPREGWNEVQKELARQIESGNKLSCQAPDSPIALFEFGAALQADQHGYAFGTRMMSLKRIVEGARWGYRNLNLQFPHA